MSFTIKEAWALEESLRLHQLEVWHKVCSLYVIPTDLQSKVPTWILEGQFETRVRARKTPPIEVLPKRITVLIKKEPPSHTPTGPPPK